MKTNFKKVGLVSVGAMLTMLLALSFGSNSADAAIVSNLGVGSHGAQVTELQNFLATNSFVYPAALVTGYYGGMTQAAVIQYQLAYNISPVGTVGPITRASINNVMASGLGLDLSAPTILSLPTVHVSNTNVAVTWSTNEAARGKLIYGTSPIVISNTGDTTGMNFIEPSVVSGNLAPYDATPRFSQTILVGNLMPNTTYYYMVMALDASNNVSVTTPASFHTNQ